MYLNPPKRRRYAANKSTNDMNYYDRLFSTLWLGRFRMRTGLATRVQLSRRSVAFHCGMPNNFSKPCTGVSYSMSMPSSPEVEHVREDNVEVEVDVDAEVDVDEVREVTSLIVHCSSSSIIWTSFEMSRACDELHCMREFDWRCMRRSEAETREYVGRGAAQASSSSLGGVSGPPLRSFTFVSMRRVC